MQALLCVLSVSIVDKLRRGNGAVRFSVRGFGCALFYGSGCNMGFGENLRAARRAADLTQQQVADAICVHRTTYTKYENQGVEPPLSVLRKLTVLLRVSADALLSEDMPVPVTENEETPCPQRRMGRRVCPICHRLFPNRR